MRLSDLDPDVQYAVLGEHTLGIVRDSRPNWFEVLAGKITRGGYDWKNGPVSIANGAGLRPATFDDFADYRVVPPPGFTDPTGEPE